VPKLQEAHAQHRLYSSRRPAALARVIARLYNRHELGPGDQGVHLPQEILAATQALALFVLHVVECQLRFHSCIIGLFRYLISGSLADFPTLFGEIRQPETNYLLIPRVSSERRKCIPIGFLSKDVIAGDSTLVIPNATLYEFGILTSIMHMAWVRYVCGRLEMRYRYSASIVYNNYPWPSPTGKQASAIETAAQNVLDARNKYPDLSLATLYDSNTMIPELVKSHQKLDKAVEAAYGRAFEDDGQRVALLFELWQNAVGELFVEGKGRKSKT